jgi:serine/threonine-protein kinase
MLGAPAMPVASSLLGRTLAGRFRITGFIGEGAMAAVYRGYQDAEPHDVAIKIMHPQLLGDATFTGRFRREAKAAARLKHPSTVQIIDYGVDGTLPYIAMELLKGRDLFEILAREHRLAEARAVRILMGICDALEVAHEHGIVHRDLKPENVMILPDAGNAEIERVKVLDFGIAKILDAGPAVPGEEGAPSSLGSLALTTVGMAVGTPAYMSPEQCRGDPVDGRSDLYSCGVMLFLLVTGRLPFAATGAPWEVAMEHLRRAPPAPSTFLPHIHPGLEAAILIALAKWPAQRQQSARELREELARLLPDLPEATRDGAPAGPPPDADTLPIVSLRSRSVPSVRSFIEGGDLAMAPTLPVIGAGAPSGEAPKPPEVPAPGPAVRAASEREPSRHAKLASRLVVPAALLLGVALGALALLLIR